MGTYLKLKHQPPATSGVEGRGKLPRTNGPTGNTDAKRCRWTARRTSGRPEKVKKWITSGAKGIPIVRWTPVSEAMNGRWSATHEENARNRSHTYARVGRPKQDTTLYKHARRETKVARPRRATTIEPEFVTVSTNNELPNNELAQRRTIFEFYDYQIK